MICPHCVVTAIEAGTASFIGIPVVLRMFRNKLTSRKTARQEAAKANFAILYGKGPEMDRANPGFVAFQKAMHRGE